MNRDEALRISKELEKWSVADLYEAQGKYGDISHTIYPVHFVKRFSGIAVTARGFQGSVMGAVIDAMEKAQPGDVLVIDAGDESSTSFGGSTAFAAHHRGIAALITNGYVRDIAEIKTLAVSVYAAGVNIRGSLRSHRGWIQIPVSIGGCVIHPGDFIVGDEDGLLAIRPERVFPVLEAVREKDARNQIIRENIRKGMSLRQALEEN